MRNWLAPAVACCLTLVTLFGSMASSWNHSGAREARAVYMVSMPSTAGKAAYGVSATDENLEWNVWPRASFDWTNEGQFLSTNRSLQVARTNYLMQ
jgi:hypothetical protein